MTDLCQGCGYQFDSPRECYAIRHPDDTREYLFLCRECVDAIQERWSFAFGQ